jgi:hypothetical protein
MSRSELAETGIRSKRLAREESVEWFIEDQAFLQSFDSAPRPPPLPPIPSASCLSFSVFLCVTSELTDGRGGGGWRGAKSYDREKAWPSIYHSLLFGLECLTSDVKVATVLRSILASSADPVDSEWRQMKHCWIKYLKYHKQIRSQSKLCNTILTKKLFYSRKSIFIFKPIKCDLLHNFTNCLLLIHTFSIALTLQWGVIFFLI